MNKFFKSKFQLGLTLMFLVLAIGVIGFYFIANLSWLDSIYMTIITVSTVGFGEMGPMDGPQKIFTIFLIVTSVFLFGFAISVITEYLLNRSTSQSLKSKKVKQQIDKLKNHVIVCGYGRNGMQVVKRLSAYKRPYVVIEQNKETIEKFEDEILFVEGDANEDDVLLKAGIERAQSLITALPDDSTNLFVVLSARQLNNNLFLISRASQLSSQKKILLAGADKVIMPDKIGGDHMAQLVVIPDLITFMDQLSIEGGQSTNLEEVAIEDFSINTEGSSLRDLDLRKKTGCTIIGYITPDGQYIINPDADLQLQPKSKVIVLGRPEQIQKLYRVFNVVPEAL